MARKGENIYKRKDGRWEGRYIKSRNDDGKIKYGYVYSKKYIEVKEKLIIQKADYAKYKPLKSNFYTLYSEWLHDWCENDLKKNIKESTFSVYKGMIKNYLLRYFGSKSLTSIDQRQIQNFINELEVRGLSSGYIRNLFHILQMSFKEAEKKGYVHFNPCNNINLPKNKNRPFRALSLNKQKKLEVIALESP